MHKKYLSIVLSLLFIGYSCMGMKINRTVNNVDREYMENKIGGHMVLLMPWDEYTFNYVKAAYRQSRISDDDASSDTLQSLRYQELQYEISPN